MSHAAAPHAPHDPRPHDLGRHPRLDDAIARAAGYLARAQGREDDPRWRDYTDAEGRKGSNVWAAAFIAAWARHIDTCARDLPSARRLVLRTHELGASAVRLASFLQIDASTLDTTRGHANRRTFEASLDALLPAHRVDGIVGDLAGAHLARLFPGVVTRTDALRLWA